MPTIVLDAFFSLHCCQFYGYKNSLQYVPFETNRANARSYDPQAGAKLARTPATQGDIRGYMLVLIARGCADGTAEGVAGAGGETPVGVARVPSCWHSSQPPPNGRPTSPPRQPPRDCGRAGRAVDLWGIRIVPAFLFRQPIPRRWCRLPPVGPLLHGV